MTIASFRGIEGKIDSDRDFHRIKCFWAKYLVSGDPLMSVERSPPIRPV